MSNTLIFLFTQILKTTYAHITYCKYYINIKKFDLIASVSTLSKT